LYNLKKYLYIGLGGFLGSISRFVIREISIYHYMGHIPINTLIINITGSFILAFLLTAILEVFEADTDLSLGASAGFLGAYTTFSTLCKETVNLMLDNNYYPAIFYISISAVLSLAAAYSGTVLAGKVVMKYAGKKNKKDFENKISVHKKGESE